MKETVRRIMQYIFDTAEAKGLDGERYLELLEELEHEIECHIEITQYTQGVDEDEY